MNVKIQNLLEHLEEAMMKAMESMEHDFSGIRTGKASPALVENITAMYYGNPTRVKELAGITVPEPKLVVIQPWDPTALAAIEKAIIGSNLGISPLNDGRVLRLPIPDLSEERRTNLAKQVKTRAEDAKIAVRNVRRDGNEAAKKAQKDSEITEDELKLKLDAVQKMTDKYIKEIDDAMKAKENELMSL